MDGGEHGRIGHSAASRYARPPPPAPVHIADTRARPLTTPSTNTAITLDQIRTGPRPQNEYVDNPTASQVPAIPPRRVTTTQPQPVVNPRDILHTIVPRPERETLLPSERTTPSSQPIFRQPTPSALKVPNTTETNKDNVISKDITVDSEHGRHSTAESIICHRCGRCKCHQCTQRRELPHTWICNNKCRCSAMDMVEYCSCLNAVKAVFYHCLDSDDDCGEGAADHPCGCCEQAQCCKRWTTMGLLSICFPCLCCYWPMRCAVSACTACYNRCTRRGCHCRKDKCQNMSRLLIDSESSSA